MNRSKYVLTLLLPLLLIALNSPNVLLAASISKESVSDVTPPNEATSTVFNGLRNHFTNLMGRMLPNQNQQPCQTPSGGRGFCKYPQHCQLPDVKAHNLWKALSYLCIVDKIAVGVCCPASQSELNTTTSEQKVVNSPQDGVDSDEPPVWSAIGPDSNRIDDAAAVPPTTTPTRPEERGCGLATKTFPRIVGGRPADPGEWPWMAAILQRGKDMPICGGVLISDRHVLTAAHCTKRRTKNELFVRLGEYDFADFNETRARDFRVADIVQHEDFDDLDYTNDIALLKLDRVTTFNSYIWPICMPPGGSKTQNFEGQMAVVTGWGTQSFGGPTSQVLMEVSMPVWTHQQCKDSFAQRITTNVLCAGGYEGGRDSCQGDSGGPLMLQLPNRRWVTIGIVSWGVRCGEPNYPGIYTRVDGYADWVAQNALF